MITTGASPIELKFDVVIDGVPTRKSSIQTVSIGLQENMHNLAVLDVAGIPQQYLTDYMDAPISIRIDVGNISSHYFVGYVSYLEPISKTKDGLVNNSPFQLTKLFCFGATYVMKNKRIRVWDNRTLPQIAEDIVKDYGLSLSVPDDKFVFPRIYQNGKSDWEILVQICDYLGYYVMSRGAHIEIWNPFSLLTRNKGATPIYAMFGVEGDVKTKPGQVLSFRAFVGSATPFEEIVPSTAHVLTNKKIFTASEQGNSNYGQPIDRLFTNEAPENLVSVEQAERFLSGHAYLPITAHATIVGDPSIEPGMLVSLAKYDSGVDGLWIVKSAKHNMFRGSTTSELVLKRDTVYSDDAVRESNPSSFPYPVPAPILRNKKWISPKEIVNVYS